MQCECGVTNPETARFCHNCGKALAASSAVAPPPGAGPSPTPPPYVPEPDPGWSLSRVFKPIPNLKAAQAMARVGAIGSAMIGAVGLLSMIGTSRLPQAALGAALYGACAVGLWRGSRLAGWAAVILYGCGLAISLLLFPFAGYSSSDWALIFCVYVLAPLALLSGLRGVLAWRRFSQPPPAPAPR